MNPLPPRLYRSVSFHGPKAADLVASRRSADFIRAPQVLLDVDTISSEQIAGIKQLLGSR